MARSSGNSAVVTRPYRPEDLAAYVALLAETSVEEYAGLAKEDLQHYLQLLDKKHVWVAELRGEPVGFASFRIEEPGVHVLLLDVEERCRRRGIGSELLTCGQKLARDRGEPLFLEVYAANWLGRRFYEHHGFESTGYHRDYYGPGKDALTMIDRRTARNAD